MKLNKHIAYRLLTDESLAWEITELMHPDIKNGKLSKDGEKSSELIQAMQTFHLVSPHGQKAYYITDTVFDKLDMLKVSRKATYPVREQPNVKPEYGEVAVGAKSITTFDWNVFSNTDQVIKPGERRKYTFILPDNSVIRLETASGYMVFFYLKCTSADWENNWGNINWVMFWINIQEKVICSHWAHKDVQNVEEMIYKLLCFIYLSENEEMVVLPGGKHGTRKQGKIVNSLVMPVTVVTSKWNVTSIRTEGFEVSGHFRLQPYKDGPKMIFIDPFMKKGYVRRAKSENQ